jgi:hypothetical protein
MWFFLRDFIDYGLRASACNAARIAEIRRTTPITGVNRMKHKRREATLDRRQFLGTTGKEPLVRSD